MTKVENTLVYLYEARKSYKNHIPNNLREKVDISVKIDSYLHRQGIKTTNELIDYIEKKFRNHNPQVLLRYVEWVLKVYSSGTHASLLFLVSLDETIQLLLKYHRLFSKKLINDLDSYDIKRFKEFKDLIDSIHDPRDETEYYGRREAKLVFENSSLKLVKVETFEACAFFSGGSRGRSKPWCIAGNKGDWDEFTRNMKARWYILLIKGSGEKYAIDERSGNSYDEDNEETTFEEVAREYSIIKKYIKIEFYAMLDTLEEEIFEYLESEMNIDYSDIEFQRGLGGWDALYLGVIIYNLSNLDLIDKNRRKISDAFQAIANSNNLDMYTFTP